VPGLADFEDVQLLEGAREGENIRGVDWRMGGMTERRTTRRYDLSLPIIIRIPTERTLDSQQGKTRDISTRGLYFIIDQNLEAGSELDITLTLPAEITHGTEVFVRALGKVVRVERRMEEDSARMGVAAVIERFDIIRGEAARA
jgi:PilZ domain